MVSISTFFSAVQMAAKVIGKEFNNSELESFAERLNLELNTHPFLLKHRAEALRGQLSNIYDKLLPSTRQKFQDILSQFCVEQEIAVPFDVNGNLDIHIDNFPTEFKNPGEMVVDTGELLGDSSEVVASNEEGVDIASNVTEIVSDDADVISDVADSVADGADSIWDFISSLFS